MPSSSRSCSAAWIVGLTLSLTAGSAAAQEPAPAPAADAAAPAAPAAPSAPVAPSGAGEQGDSTGATAPGTTDPIAVRAASDSSMDSNISTSAQSRPFRLGFRALNPLFDRQKPLAMIDPAGFVVNSGVLVGSFDDAWIGGLSMTTLKMQWWLEGKSGLTAPPGSFGSNVVLGLRDGRVMKVEALTGKKLWSIALDSFTERQFLLNGTTLYVLTAAQVLYALDFQTGKTLWLYDGGFPDGLTIRGGARPIVHDNKVIFGLASGELLAVTADAGKLVWRYNPAYNDARFHDVVGEMVVRNNKLLITRYDGLVAAIDLASAVRSVLWQEQLPGLTTSTYRNGRYFVGGLNGDVYALDPDNGKRAWRTVTGAAITTITAGETTLFVAGAEGRISALETAGGGIMWHDKLGSTLASPPVLFDNAIHYTTGHKSLYSYRLR